jgi:hypothetical protein
MFALCCIKESSMDHKWHEGQKRIKQSKNGSKGKNPGQKKIPSGACMSVSCECCVLSGRGLCDGLVTRPEESYRV